MSFDEARTINDCIETATLDCYTDEEVASGWYTCLEEILEGVKQVKILGEEVKLKGLDFQGTQVVAVCIKGKKQIKVTLDSIELIKPSKVQQLWLKAWNRWSKGQGADIGD